MLHLFSLIYHTREEAAKFFRSDIEVIMRTALLCFSLFITSLSYGKIVETQHFQEIQSHLDSETLVLLDIDDTLLIPVQMLGCDEWFQCRMQKHQQEGATISESLEKSLAEWEAVRHLTQMEIVEQGSEKIVHKLQNQKYMVMGLTTQGLALATRTKQQLMEKGIDLKRTAPSQKDCYLTIGDHGILFRAGILFTSGAHKGKALFGLLKKLEYTPRRIVFINDKASHLRSIEETAKEEGVEFIGLRYAYSDARKAAFNKEIADYQFTHSTFTHLLSDEEARNQLNSRH